MAQEKGEQVMSMHFSEDPDDDGQAIRDQRLEDRMDREAEAKRAERKGNTDEGTDECVVE